MAVITSSGTATGVNDLLDQLRAFLVANSWTANLWATSGSGKVLCVQKSTDIFANMRSLVNEQYYPGGVAASVYGVGLAGSTGYDSAVPWYNQPGAAVRSGHSRPNPAPGIVGVTAAIPGYDFFLTGNMCYVVVQYAVGFYQMFAFGKIDKEGTWTGGQIFFGSNDVGNATPQNYTTFSSPPFSGGNFILNPNAYLRGVIDSNTGWMSGYYIETMSPAMPRFFESLCLSTTLAMNAANQFNGLPILLPISVHAFRDGTGQPSATSNHSVVGYLPDIYLVNLRALSAGQTITIGSDTFKVFPFRSKGSIPNISGSTTGWFGYAIKSN